MIKVELPSGESYDLDILITDFNGTLAVDGILSEGVKERLRRLAEQIEIIVLTSDTQGSAAEQLSGLPVELKKVEAGTIPGIERASKQAAVACEVDRNVVYFGNGSNDAAAIPHARLSVVVVGPEGACMAALRQADMVVPSAEDALDLLLKPKRLISGLRN